MHGGREGLKRLFCIRLFYLLYFYIILLLRKTGKMKTIWSIDMNCVEMAVLQY